MIRKSAFSTSLFLAGSIAVLLGAFNNCSQAKFDGQGASTSPTATSGTNADLNGSGPIPGSGSGSFPDLRKACLERPLQTRSLSVDFPNPKNTTNSSLTCDWSSNENLGTRDGHFQARVEQVLRFELPSGARLCDLEFTVPNQQMIFDDHIVFVLDDAVIAASYPLQDILPINDGIMTYSWSAMVGKRWPLGNVDYVYCLGQDEGFASCSWPKTETPGVISIRFNPLVFQGIAARDVSRTSHELKLITTGDNDRSKDCQHSPLNFAITARYID